MNIKFFERPDGLMDDRAIKPGVYIVRLAKSSSIDKSIPLYIGESYSMAQRCGRHLYETMMVNPVYFGLTKQLLEDKRLVYVFEVLECVDKKWSDINERNRELKALEKQKIQELNPISQFTTSDRVLPNRMEVVPQKIESFLKEE